MAAISLISIIQKNFKLPTPPKVWISAFPIVHINGISALVIMKKLKNGCHFFNIDRIEKFQITAPTFPKFGSLVFRSVNGNGISASVIMKKLKNGCHFFNIDHIENFQITNLPQSLDLWFSEC